MPLSAWICFPAGTKEGCTSCCHTNSPEPKWTCSGRMWRVRSFPVRPCFPGASIRSVAECDMSLRLSAPQVLTRAWFFAACCGYLVQKNGMHKRYAHRRSCAKDAECGFAGLSFDSGKTPGWQCGVQALQRSILRARKTVWHKAWCRGKVCLLFVWGKTHQNIVSRLNYNKYV